MPLIIHKNVGNNMKKLTPCQSVRTLKVNALLSDW